MWIFNVILYFFWLLNPAIYEGAVAAGATCWSYIPAQGEVVVDAPPPCPYEPTKDQ